MTPTRPLNILTDVLHNADALATEIAQLHRPVVRADGFLPCEER